MWEKIGEILAEARGEFAEVFAEEVETTSLVCEENKIEKIISGKDAGYGLRVITGTTTTYNCKTMEPETKRLGSLIPIEQKVEIVNLINKTTRSFGEKIKQVTVRYNDTLQKVKIVNSEGLSVEDERLRTRVFIQVVAAKDGVLQTGIEAPGILGGFELFAKYSPEEIARKAAERALLMLEAQPAPAGKLPVVLAAEAGGVMIHEACGHGLEADYVLKETSIYTGKFGTKVASELVTVIDDATLIQNHGSFKFDDEGTPAQKTILIENGILKNYLTDRYNAKLLKLKPTGNGRRESFRFKPVPRMTNTFIAPGKTDPKEIIDSIKYGLLVKKMGGGEVNPVNGDFVFEVSEGYLIENGKIKYPVRGAVLTGNGPEVLKQIDMVGSDLDFMAGVCGKFDHVPVSDGQPTLRIPAMIVGGRI